MSKLKQNFQKTRLAAAKVTGGRAHKFLLLGALVLIGLGLVWAIYYFTKPNEKETKVDCRSVSSSAKDLLSKDQREVAYKTLKDAADQCSNVKDESVKDPSRVADYIGLMEYSGDLAVAAFAAGDKENAKRYAEQGIQLNESRTQEQSGAIPRDDIQRLNNSLINMYDIRDGYFQYSPAPSSNNGEAQ